MKEIPNTNKKAYFIIKNKYTKDLFPNWTPE